MAIDPNWFRMPDVGGNALAAFHQARAEKKQEDAQKAFATFATNPEDPNALNALAQYDPKFVVERKQSMVSENQKAMLEGAKVLGEAAMAADTPEKWDAAVDYLSQYYPKIAEYKGKFSPQLREATIASAGQMKAYIEQGKPVTVGPGSHLVDPATGKPKFSAPFAPRPVTLSPGQTAVEYDPNASAGDPAAIWKRMIHTESRGQHFTKNGQVITSPAGAIGIAQVMPGTAPEAARLAGVPFDEQRYRNDPAYNEQLGQAYFQEQLRTFGDPEKAVAAYNAGPGNVQKAVAKGGENWKQYLPGETKGYLQSVFGGGTRVIGRGDPKPPKENDPPSGYRWKQDGTLEPIPGGPAADKAPGANPAYSQSAIDAFNRAMDSANRLLKHPGLETSVGVKGVTGGFLGGWVVPGTDAADFNAELDAMKAQVFLPMVQSMKGMGALSNAEGEKLTASIGALSTKMSEGAFKASLNRIINDLKTYRDRGMPQAASKPTASAAKPVGGTKVIRYDAKGNRIP